MQLSSKGWSYTTESTDGAIREIFVILGRKVVLDTDTACVRFISTERLRSSVEFQATYIAPRLQWKSKLALAISIIAVSKNTTLNIPTVGGGTSEP